jgi:hypothetical protein
MTTPTARNPSIKIKIASGFIILLLLLPSYTGYSWSSTEITGKFTTHQFLTRTAYSFLQKHPMLAKKLIDFPTLEEIELFSGVKAEITSTGMKVTGNGPDNTANSSYADHYFNPSLAGGGAGNGPKKVGEYYRLLRESLRTKPRAINASMYAAYLAHYIQDMSCPFHVLGTPDNKLKYTETATGPYSVVYTTGLWEPKAGMNQAEYCTRLIPDLEGTTLNFKHCTVESFWISMAERFQYDNQPGANWFESNYYDGPVCPSLYTYLSTHFMYEAFVALYHNNSQIIARFNQMNDYNYFGKTWNLLNMDQEKRASELASQNAQMTKINLDLYTGEYMLDPEKKMEFARILLKNLNNPGLSNDVNRPGFAELMKKIPLPEQAWKQSIQATYTLLRASFSALYIDFNKDVKLHLVGYSPASYVLRVKVTNHETEDDAKNVVVGIKYVTGQNTFDLGEATVGNISRKLTSSWADCRNAFTLPSGCSLELNVTGDYTTVSDAGEARFSSDKIPVDPLGGLWYMNEARASVAVLYNSDTQEYEGRVVRQGDLTFHGPGALLLSGIQSVEKPVTPSQQVANDNSYAGTECSWEVLTNTDGSYRKGPQTRLPVSIMVNGNTMVYRTKDDTFHFTRQ